MNCASFARLIDELVDGTLDAARASGVRGHARACAACAARLAETEALKAGLGKLEALDPPPSLWAGIQEQLDRAEAADAERPRWWWWWQGARRHVFVGAAALAAAGVIVAVWNGRGPGQGATPAPGVAAPSAPKAPAEAPAAGKAEPELELVDQRLAEVQRAEADYAAAVARLEQAIAAERPGWQPEAARAFDENLAVIDAAVDAQRAAWRAAPDDLGALDALHASYRARLDFLREAVVRGPLAGAGKGQAL